MLEIYDKSSLEHKQAVNLMMLHQEIGMELVVLYYESQGLSIPLYCKPDNLRLTGEQAFQIFREEAERVKNLNKPIGVSGVYLLVGLMRTFPCK